MTALAPAPLIFSSPAWSFTVATEAPRWLQGIKARDRALSRGKKQTLHPYTQARYSVQKGHLSATCNKIFCSLFGTFVTTTAPLQAGLGVTNRHQARHGHGEALGAGGGFDRSIPRLVSAAARPLDFTASAP